MGMAATLYCSYLLPFRRVRFDPVEVEDLVHYFAEMAAAGCEILVVDGSPPAVFERHHERFAPDSHHTAVDRRFDYLNDKVNGVHTGVELASFGKIILADDDIRYSRDQISEIAALLDKYEVVRPQNFLKPLPWWATLEAARMLINRATLRAADYPGTCAFRRETMRKVGHYDGDVLFDNEEIIRHFVREKVPVCYANDLFVRKKPPAFRKWIEQRPRQAYEDFGMRTKTILFAAILPLFVAMAVLYGPRSVMLSAGAVAAISISLAWRGRLRGKAAAHFGWCTCLAAPFWIGERALSTYMAFYWYLTRGGYPFGGRILAKGIGRDWWHGSRFGRR